MLNIEFASSLGQGLWQFVSYMGLAIFAENVILARALGVGFVSAADLGHDAVRPAGLGCP